MQSSCDPGGHRMARDWRYIPNPLLRGPIFALRACTRACMRHVSVIFMGSPRVPASHLSFLVFAFCWWFSLSFLTCFCFMLLLELCRCSSDLFLSSRPRIGSVATYITGYGWVQSVNAKVAVYTLWSFIQEWHIFRGVPVRKNPPETID